EMEMQARHGNLFLRLAEPKLDAALVGLHGIDRLNGQEGEDCKQHDHGSTAIETARHDATQTLLATPDDVLQIRRAAIAAAIATTTARPIRPTAPGALIVTTAAAPRAAAILIAPGHQNLFACRSTHTEARLPGSFARYRDATGCFQRSFNNFRVFGNEMFQFAAGRRT